MFGSLYADYPELLLSSFGEMNKSYLKVSRIPKKSVMQLLESWYLRIWGVPEIGFQVRTLHFLKTIKRIPLDNSPQLLDAGSGIGCYVLELARRYPEGKVTGWDLDKYKIRASQKIAQEKHLFNARFVLHDLLQSAQEKNKFDFIFNIDVLEHITSYKKVLKTFFALLKSGGYLYIHTPQTKQKRFFKHFRKWSHEDHVREGFVPSKLTKDLEAIGFQVIDHWNTFGTFGSLAWELNHLCLTKSFVLAGLTFPFLYLPALIDRAIINRVGLAAGYLVKKP